MTYIDFETNDWEAEAAGPGILFDLIASANGAARTDWERNFVESVSRQFDSKGFLSPKQVAILEKIANPPQPERQRQAARPTGIDLSTVPAGRYAVPGGDTRLKIRIDKPTDGKWAGFVFVKDAAEYGQGKRYGMQRPGDLYRGDIQDALRAIVADPLAAAAAYGHLTGSCGVCGRHLEDEQSVARGIGPICFEKFGGAS